MRVAVISDIHANFHALQAVLEAIEQERPDVVWCLGDLVGYGPQPNPCCEWAASGAQVCLAGNHDLGVLGTLDLTDFSPDADAVARWTREALAEEPRTFLGGLSSSAERDGVGLYHGSPRDPVWEYVLSWEVARESLQASAAGLVLVGHSHVPLAIPDGEAQAGGHAAGGTELDLGEARWLLNPGSVGQPRDGDPDAAWLLLDLEARHASFRRAAYDVVRTQAEIRELGLPDALAERLGYGV